VANLFSLTFVLTELLHEATSTCIPTMELGCLNGEAFNRSTEFVCGASKCDASYQNCQPAVYQWATSSCCAQGVAYDKQNSFCCYEGVHDNSVGVCKPWSSQNLNDGSGCYDGVARRLQGSPQIVNDTIVVDTKVLAEQPCSAPLPTEGCLNGYLYNYSTQMPCGDYLVNVQSHGCCTTAEGIKPYNLQTQTCCKFGGNDEVLDGGRACSCSKHTTTTSSARITTSSALATTSTTMSTALVTTSTGTAVTTTITVASNLNSITQYGSEAALKQQLEAGILAAAGSDATVVVEIQYTSVQSTYGGFSQINHDDMITAYAAMAGVSVSQVTVNNQAHSSIGGGRRLLSDATVVVNIPNSAGVDCITESQRIIAANSPAALLTELQAVSSATYANSALTLPNAPVATIAATTKITGTAVAPTVAAVQTQVGSAVGGTVIATVTSSAPTTTGSPTQTSSSTVDPVSLVDHAPIAPMMTIWAAIYGFAMS